MFEATISSVRRATLSTRIIRLCLEGPFSYRAGQVAEIGPASSALRVPFSIASAPEDTRKDGHLEFLVKLDGQGCWGDRFVEPRRGQRLGLQGPLGAFVFPDAPVESRFLMIAGGTGIAPLRSMIRHGRAGAHGTFRLLYSARTPLDFAYRRELCGMARRREITLILTTTRDATTVWKGERGRITKAQLAALVDHPETLCFVCGPAAMVDDVPRMLRDLGIDRSRIRLEEW